METGGGSHRTADFEHLLVSTERPTGVLTLNRPETRNALTLSTMEELIAAAAWFDDQPDIKVVVLAGAGDSFCAGADLSTLQQVFSQDPGPEELAAADLGRRMTEAIAGMSAITIARLHGHCVGGGLVLAAGCDLRVASTETVFSIPEVDLGIPLGWGATPRLVRELGPAMTMELITTCRAASAAELHRLGFLNRVASSGDLDATVSELVTAIGSKPSYALRTTKQRLATTAESLATTAGSEMDANLLLGAVTDAESVAAARTYLRRFGRGTDD